MAISVDTPIPTPYGWKPAGDIVKGDIVFDNLGNQVEVKSTQVSEYSLRQGGCCFYTTHPV